MLLCFSFRGYLTSGMTRISVCMPLAIEELLDLRAKPLLFTAVAFAAPQLFCQGSPKSRTRNRSRPGKERLQKELGKGFRAV